jgi:hypothetical protein
MTCQCVSCGACGGTGHIWTDFRGRYLGQHRSDDTDELESCPDCDGSGITEECDSCSDSRVDEYVTHGFDLIKGVES